MSEISVKNIRNALEINKKKINKAVYKRETADSIVPFVVAYEVRFGLIMRLLSMLLS